MESAEQVVISVSKGRTSPGSVPIPQKWLETDSSPNIWTGFQTLKEDLGPGERVLDVHRPHE